MTELVLFIVCSGSLSGVEADPVGGFNARLAQQNKEAGG